MYTKILLWLKNYWGVVLAVLVAAKYFFRGRSATPIDKSAWRKRKVLKEHEDDAKEKAVDTLVDNLDDSFDERKERHLSRARSDEK